MVVCDLGNPMKAGTKVRFGPAHPGGQVAFSLITVVFGQEVFPQEFKIRSDI